MAPWWELPQQFAGDPSARKTRERCSPSHPLERGALNFLRACEFGFGLDADAQHLASAICGCRGASIADAESPLRRRGWRSPGAFEPQLDRDQPRLFVKLVKYS